MSMSDIGIVGIHAICHNILDTAFTVCVLPAKHEGVCQSQSDCEIARLQSILASKEKEIVQLKRWIDSHQESLGSVSHFEIARLQQEQQAERFNRLESQLQSKEKELSQAREKIEELDALVIRHHEIGWLRSEHRVGMPCAVCREHSPADFEALKALAAEGKKLLQSLTAGTEKGGEG